MVEININHHDRKLMVDSSEQTTFVNDIPTDFELIKIDENSYKILGKKTIHNVEITNLDGKRIDLVIDNTAIQLNASDHIDQMLEQLGMDLVQSNALKEIKAPMPGSILDIIVNEGDEVNPDDHLLVLEAMKMENVIKAPGAGTVDKIHVSEKQNVEKNQVLISFE